MNNEKAIQILLIEDNEFEVNEFKEHISIRNDVKLIKSTNSSYEGIKYVKTYMPDGILLDLELHKGEGSGMKFLEELQSLELDFKPLIIVTTNVFSNIIYNKIRELGADFIFYKKQSDYCAEMVVNSICSLKSTLHSSSKVKTTAETPIEHEQRIKDKLNSELDLIGISNHLKGRKYLFDAIFYLLENKSSEDETVFNYVANMHKVGNSSISRAMQTAINYAWRITAIDDLILHYKARINPNTGVPTPTEFVYYYAEKIKKYI